VGGRTENEAQRSGSCLAVLSEDASGAADSIGSTIRLDNGPCEVIGVMSKDVASLCAGLNPLGGIRADRVTVWTPFSVAEDTLNNRGVHLMVGVARLRQGASAARADAQMHALREYWSATDRGSRH
jgi:MacB-like periplasmic core domain